MLFRMLRGRAGLLCCLFVCIGVCKTSFGDTLRIVDWNIEDDIDGNTTPLPGFNTVLQGIGNEIVSGNAQPLDILALEETTSNTTTIAPIVSDLNTDYPGSTYKMSSYQGTQDGSNSDGNGPNGLVYNSSVLNLIASVGVGTPGGSANGEYRQVIRYEFQPVNGAAPFYVYDSHMKSGTGSTNAGYRGEEATIIRNDEANLPSNASVIYMGDLNADPTESGETQFTIFGSPTATNSSGQTVTQGSATDPLGYPTSNQYWSESATDLRYRDDYQLMTANVINGTGAINYVPSSLHYFGNNGTTGSGGNVSSSSNTDLAYMASGYTPSQSAILSALTTASDHLPNIADYTYTDVPEPSGCLLFASVAGFALTRRRGLDRR